MIKELKHQYVVKGKSRLNLLSCVKGLKKDQLFSNFANNCLEKAILVSVLLEEYFPLDGVVLAT